MLYCYSSCCIFLEVFTSYILLLLLLLLLYEILYVITFEKRGPVPCCILDIYLPHMSIFVLGTADDGLRPNNIAYIYFR